ncbi:MAG: OmpA family protein [Aureispira sp.]|nr:OmpA family protein [Aureispira sp.]
MKRIAYAFFAVTICCCFFATTGHAQLAKANKMFRELNYRGAADLYETVLSKKTVPEALFNVAECYRKMGNYRNAEHWYAQAILHPEATPEMFFYLGMAQLSNGNPQAAKPNFEQYLAGIPEAIRGPKLIAACNDTVRKELMNAGALYQVGPVDALNTKFDDFGATFYGKGILFCSEQDTGTVAKYRSAWTGRPFVDLFYAKARLIDEDKKEFKYGTIEKYHDRLNTRLHDGPICMTADKRKMYITRNAINKNKASYSRNGLINLQIMETERTSSGWSKLKAININNPEYSIAHPAMNKYGDKMYFASDIPGGFGGFDLYVSYLENNDWSHPINLGPEINTEGDEVFPFVTEDGELYFSSDGHVGLGGFDIYTTKVRKGVWDEVTNLGNPINSSKDEITFVMDSTKLFGYFASNREGGKGFTDIYSFTKLTVEAEVLVFDRTTGRGIKGVTMTSECFPKSEFETDIEGKVYIQLPLDRNCKFIASSAQYGETEVDVSTKGYVIGSNLFIQVPYNEPKFEFSVNGTVKDLVTGEPITDGQVTLLSSCSSENQTAVVDGDGKYAFDLENNCCYVVKVVKDGYFTTTSNFCTKGLNESKVFETEGNINMEKFLTLDDIEELGLDTTSIYRVENIYYGYDRSDVDRELSTDLDRLLTVMEENPDFAIEIRSHTDARGNAEYNETLSTRRAKSIADYLIENGVEEDRVSYKGFGETKLVNGCSDGVPCTDDEHRMNRRTEFKVKKRRSSSEGGKL